MKPKHKGFKRLFNIAGYSWNGIKACFKNEVAFRQELGVMLISIPLAIWLANSAVEFILLVGCLILLLAIEILNTAIEMLVDRHGDEWNELSGLAKDMGAAAVMVMIILCVFVWGAIIVSRMNLNFF